MGLVQKTLAIFAPILILTGILGFIVPAEYAMMSGAPAYNVFHIVFGIIGLLALWGGYAPHFLITFGLIDIYQAIASYFALFPITLFQWTAMDDVLHVVIGIVLVAIGLIQE